MISTTHSGPTTDGVQFQATCFACGSENPHGLRLKFHVDPSGTATADLALSPQWEGPSGIVHGGIASTLLDEAMAKAAATTGCKAMTAELRVRFRESAKTGERLQLRGWVVRQEKRLIETEATLTAADGSERAHAWGKFIVVVTATP